MLTKTSSITEPLITDEVSELLNIITGVPPTNFPHKGAQSDKQILETLTKLTEKVDKLSEQVNEPKKVTSNHGEPTEGLEASKHVPHLLTKSYAQAANTVPKNLPTSDRPPTSQNPKTPNPNKAHDPTRLVVCFLLGTNTTTREDNLTTVNNINRYLKENGAPDKLAITAIKWNHQGNCIIITHCQERNGVGAEWPKIEWDYSGMVGFDNKIETTLASARALCLDLLSCVWLHISGGWNCC